MGCDKVAKVSSSDKPYFNPRTRMGCDVKGVRTQVYLIKFQSTHPYGVRLAKSVMS